MISSPYLRLLRKEQVCDITGLSFSSLKRLERVEQFPARVQISGQAVGWYEHEVQEWIANRKRATEAPKSGYAADPVAARKAKHAKRAA